MKPPHAIIATITLAAILFFSSCASHRTTTSHTSTHTADTTSTTTLTSASLSYQQALLDSIIRLYTSRDSLSSSTAETASEHITETITSYIDSLGREIRTEQRTIDRNEARQQELRLQQWQQQEEQRIAAEYACIDSLYAALNQSTASHTDDNLSDSFSSEPVATLSLWGRIELWVGRHVLPCGLIAAALCVLSRYFPNLRSWLSSLFRK